MRPNNVTTTIPPASEPVSTADAKTHLRVDSSSEDSYIAGLVSAARSHAETYTKRAFVSATRTAKFCQWPGRSTEDHWEIPLPPYAAFGGMTYTDEDGIEQTPSIGSLPPFLFGYMLDGMYRIAPAQGETLPTIQPGNQSPITFIYLSGSAVSAVDPAIVAAIKMIVSDLYENRGEDATELTPRVRDLLKPFRLEIA